LFFINYLLTSGSAKDQTKAMISKTLQNKHRVEIVKSETYKNKQLRINIWKLLVVIIISNNLPKVLQHMHSMVLWINY